MRHGERWQLLLGTASFLAVAVVAGGSSFSPATRGSDSGGFLFLPVRPLSPSTPFSSSPALLLLPSLPLGPVVVAKWKSIGAWINKEGYRPRVFIACGQGTTSGRGARACTAVNPQHPCCEGMWRPSRDTKLGIVVVGVRVGMVARARWRFPHHGSFWIGVTGARS